MDENGELEEGTFEDDISGDILPVDDSSIIMPGDEEEVAVEGDLHHTTYLPGMYKNWFLDYASYVILERAVPEVLDGLKPVQRRILHSMWELEDGRYNKVANVIGNTMKYHPHGDASIGDAMVQIDPALAYDKAPVLLWGPYLWTDGTKGRSDGITWQQSDTAADGTHPSQTGQQKVARLLLDFFTTDASAKPWFTR